MFRALSWERDRVAGEVSGWEPGAKRARKGWPRARGAAASQRAREEGWGSEGASMRCEMRKRFVWSGLGILGKRGDDERAGLGADDDGPEGWGAGERAEWLPTTVDVKTSGTVFL